MNRQDHRLLTSVVFTVEIGHGCFLQTICIGTEWKLIARAYRMHNLAFNQRVSQSNEVAKRGSSRQLNRVLTRRTGCARSAIV